MSVHEEGLLIQVKTLFIHERCTDMLDAGRRTLDVGRWTVTSHYRLTEALDLQMADIN